MCLTKVEHEVKLDRIEIVVWINTGITLFSQFKQQQQQQQQQQ